MCIHACMHVHELNPSIVSSTKPHRCMTIYIFYRCWSGKESCQSSLSSGVAATLGFAEAGALPLVGRARTTPEALDVSWGSKVII